MNADLIVQSFFDIFFPTIWFDSIYMIVKSSLVEMVNEFFIKDMHSQCREWGFKSSLNLFYYFDFSLFDNWSKDRTFWEKERIWGRRSIPHNCSYTFSNWQCLTTLFVNSPDNVVISGRRVLSATEIWRYVFCAMQNMHFAILYAIWNLNMLFLNVSLAYINLAFLMADKNAKFHQDHVLFCFSSTYCICLCLSKKVWSQLKLVFLYN